MLSEFDFEIRYIKGGENRVVDALSRRVQMNHVEAIISYGTGLEEKIKSTRQLDEKYRKIKARLQQDSEGGKDE